MISHRIINHTNSLKFLAQNISSERFDKPFMSLLTSSRGRSTALLMLVRVSGLSLKRMPIPKAIATVGQKSRFNSQS